jgi:hypothetical protein
VEAGRKKIWEVGEQGIGFILEGGKGAGSRRGKFSICSKERGRR